MIKKYLLLFIFILFVNPLFAKEKILNRFLDAYIKDYNNHYLDVYAPDNTIVDWSSGKIISWYAIPIALDDKNIGRQISKDNQLLEQRLREEMNYQVGSLYVNSVLPISYYYEKDTDIQNKILDIIHDKAIAPNLPVGNLLIGEIEIPLFGKESIGNIFYQTAYEENEKNTYEKKAIPFPKSFDTIVIDVSSFKKFKASLEIRILDENKQVLYSKNTITPSALQEKGLVYYTTSLEEAYKQKKLGENIFYVSAFALENHTDIILYHEDALKLFSNPITRDNIKNGNIVVIRNQKR